MPPDQPATGRTKPKVFIDGDVLFAGSAAPSEHGASLVVLRMAEITLLEAITSEQVIHEAERNLAEKPPRMLPTFRLIVARCLRVVPNPIRGDLLPYTGLANPADLPILASALQNGCPWLVSFNIRHYRPGHPEIAVLTPGDFLMRVRNLLARLG